MKITNEAIEKLKAIINPDSGLTEGIRIALINSCCGYSINVSKVKQPVSTDLIESHQGIKIYIDEILIGYHNDLMLDYDNEHFFVSGLPEFSNSSCCK